MGIFKRIGWNRTKSEQQHMNVVNDLCQQSQSFLNTQPTKRSIEEEIAALSGKERVCFESLKAHWEERVEASQRGEDEEGLPIFSDGMILRFARCAPAGPFNEQSAWKTMKKIDARYLDLSCGELSAQLQTRVSTHALTQAPKWQMLGVLVC
jgi:hypothetical protein